MSDPAGGGRPRSAGRSSGSAQPDRRESLRKRLLAEPLFEALMALEDGVFFHAGGRVLAANGAGARLLGAGGPEDLVGRALGELLEPAVMEVLARRAHVVEDLGASQGRLAHSVRRPDGATVDTEALSVPVRLGGRTAVLSLVRDVTEAARAQRSLVESEARLRESQRVARMGSWELDFLAGRLTWSEEIFHIFEIEPERFGASYEAFLAAVHPDDRHVVDRAWLSAVAERRPYHITHRLLLADGRVKYVEEQARITYDQKGRPVRALGTVQDVSERMRLERQLLLAGRAVASSPAATAFADMEGRITSVNEAFLRLSGCSYEHEVIGRHAMEFSGDPDLTSSHLERLAAGYGAVDEIPILRRDGSPVLAQVITSVATDAEGRKVGIVAQFLDLSERMVAARRLAESEARLRQAQKLDAIGQLAGGIAHDFNNMLVVVVGLASVLEKQLAETPGALPLVRDIATAGERASKLTRQLLAFARRQPSEPELVDVAECVDSFASLMRRTLGEHVVITTELAPDLWPIRIDPSQLEQVLLNLAVNARDAMPEGGRLEIRARNLESGVFPEAGAGPWVHLAVRDRGVGMDEATAARVFEPFFTTKEPERGTGLGLATVYGIVQQAGGAISVESRPGAGSTFHVYFPRAEGRASGRDDTEGAAPPGRNETVLVVEDDEAARATMERILEDAGYRVLAAANAQEALERARAGPWFDLLIADVVMPGGSGPSLYHALLRDRPTLPVLFVSGHAPDLQSIKDLGRLLGKPFRMQALLHAVRGVLDERCGPPRRADRR